MMRTTVLPVLLLASLAVQAQAHHSLTEYDGSRTTTFTATVREFHFVNPHPYLFVDARTGPFVTEWRLEMDNRFELVEIGISADTFKRGDEVFVSGAPGRDQKPILYVRALDRPADGLRYEQVGSRPRLARPSRKLP